MKALAEHRRQRQGSGLICTHEGIRAFCFQAADGGDADYKINLGFGLSQGQEDFNLGMLW